MRDKEGAASLRGGRHARECNRVHVAMILCTGIKAIDLGVAEPRKGIGASVESFFGVL